MINLQISASEQKRTSAPPLQLLAKLFGRLRAEGLVYCHWKSNEHLGAAMVGAADLDLLVDRRATLPLARILSELGFKRFVARPGRGYPGVEDYIGFDASSGRLTHLHVHYQLTVGEAFLKGHRLPWEDLVLSTRLQDPDYGVYIADPHLELLMLVVRAALKLRLRDFVLRGVGRRAFRGGALRELRWLRERVDQDRLLEVTQPLIGDVAAQRLVRIVGGTDPTVWQLAAFRDSVVPGLPAYRMYGPVASRIRRWGRELTARWEKAKHRLFGGPVPAPRIAPHGGQIIAFLGADGAGKSTVALEIAKWLSPQVAVLPIYGGSGEGAASPLRRLVQGLAALARHVRGAPRNPKARSRPGTQPTDRRMPRRPSGLRALGIGLSTLALAHERRRRAYAARRARSRGFVVLCDRVAQSQFPGLNDGPRLGHWLDAGPWLLRLAARRELEAIRDAELAPPDLVVKLLVSHEVAARRKPDTPPDQLAKKIEIVGWLRYPPPPARVVEVDATQPLESVLRSVKQVIWEGL